MLREKEELPAVCYSAGTQTAGAGLNLETEIKEAKEQAEQAKYATVAESLVCWKIMLILFAIKDLTFIFFKHMVYGL